MKKLLLVLILLVLANMAFCQVRRPFIAGAINMSPGYPCSYSLEVGSWGISAATSYSYTVDYVPSFNGSNVYVGFKGYYTVYDDPKICYMLYIAPKANAQDFKDALLDFGFNPNYKLNNDLLLGVSIGNQSNITSSWNLYGSMGLVLLLK